MSLCALRLGRWQDTMADVECDSLITDPPYSARTHVGARSGSKDPNYGPSGSMGNVIAYDGIDEAYTEAFVSSWAPRVRRWWVLFGDHVAADWWAASLARHGFYVFAPVVWVKLNAPPRFTGDGPASQVEYLTVARRVRESA